MELTTSQRIARVRVMCHELQKKEDRIFWTTMAIGGIVLALLASVHPF